jgi:hypothetical protein
MDAGFSGLSKQVGLRSTAARKRGCLQLNPAKALPQLLLCVSQAFIKAKNFTDTNQYCYRPD